VQARPARLVRLVSGPLAEPDISVGGSSCGIAVGFIGEAFQCFLVSLARGEELLRGRLGGSVGEIALGGWLALPRPGASRRGCAIATHGPTMLAIAAGYEKLARRAEAKAEAPATSTDVYRSSNGDRWRLITDSVSGRRVVRHEPNSASGGQITETPVEDFLAVNGPGPSTRHCADCSAAAGLPDRPDHGIGQEPASGPFGPSLWSSGLPILQQSTAHCIDLDQCIRALRDRCF
jgi:hypothetical protein